MPDPVTNPPSEDSLVLIHDKVARFESALLGILAVCDNLVSASEAARLALLDVERRLETMENLEPESQG